MALIRLNSYSLPAENLSEGNGYSVRYWYNYGFIDSAGQSVQSGSATTGTQIRASASVADGFLVVEDVQIYTTVDAQSPFPQSITLSCQVYKGNSALPIYPFNQSGCPSSWIIYNPDPNDFWEFDSLTFLQQASQPAYQQQWMVTNQEMIAYVGSIIPSGNEGFTFLADYPTLAVAVAAIGSDSATLLIEDPAAVTSNLTIPANITLLFTNAGLIQPADGVTVTILGPIMAPQVQIFDNAMSGEGRISFAGNLLVPRFEASWWGVVGDGVSGVGTDNTPIIQRIFDTLFSTDLVPGAVLRLPAGEIIIAGALQDTGASNSQLVLPKRTDAQGQYTFTIEGTNSPDMLGLGVSTAGSVLRSTLSSGTGSMVGVKVLGNTSSRSAITMFMQNLTFRMVSNPTNSALDLGYVMQPLCKNLRFTVGEVFSTATEPTTTTSFAIRTPLNHVPSTAQFSNLIISGFYIGVDWNELGRLYDVTVAQCYRAFNVHKSTHVMYGRRLLVVNCRNVFYCPDAGGGPPFFAWIDTELDEERADLTSYPSNPWFITEWEFYDPNDRMVGTCRFHIDVPFDAIAHLADVLRNGGNNIDFYEFGQIYLRNAVGTPFTNSHWTTGQSTLDGAGTVVVTLSHALSEYTNNTSYVVTANSTTTESPIKVTRISGTQFQLDGNPGDVVLWMAVGNST